MKNKKLPNKRFLSIDYIYAFVAIQDNGEGILGMHTDNGWMPLIGADMDRVESLKPIANLISEQSGIKYEIRRFKRM